MARCRSSSLRENHSDSNGSCGHTVSNSASSCANDLPGCAISAWINEPAVERSSPALRPPCRSSSQRSGQSCSGLQRRRRQGDGMSGAAPQRLHRAEGGHAVPVGRVGAGHPGGRQPGQLAGGVCAVFLSDTVGGTALGCAHDGAQPAHDGGHRQHLWCANRRRQVRGHAIGGGVAGDVVEERGRQRRVRRVAAVTAVGGGDHEPPAGPAHRGDEQPPLVGHHRGTGTDIAGHIVEDIEKSLGPQDAAAWNRVGPQAFL